MSLEQYSGGPNPFVILRDALGKLSENQRNAASHSSIIEKHKEYAEMVHNQAKELHDVQVAGRIREISAYHKLAEPGTQFQAQSGDTSVAMTTRTPKQRKPKEASATKPTGRLPIRDPKTGRAMRAPD